MKAVVYEKFGPPEVLKIQDVPKPVPEADEILIKVRAASVTAADCNVRGFTYIPPGLGIVARFMLGFSKPKYSILGSVISGVVEEVGKEVKSFRPGDKVFGSGEEMGAYAEYVCRPESGAIALKPDNISFEEAASIPYGALTAYYFLHDAANVARGQKVLVHGASGGVGVYAVQLAKILGAEVTGVCSTGNMDFVRSLGADHVIDYKKEDYSRKGEKWDVIFDVVVGKTSFSRAKRVLNPKGLYLAVAGGVSEMLQMTLNPIRGGKKVVFGGGTSCDKKENLQVMNEFIESGKLMPVMDKVFPLDQIVQAHAYVESGNKRGNVVISL